MYGSWYLEDYDNVIHNKVTVFGGGSGLAYNALLETPVFSNESPTLPITLQQSKDWAKIDDGNYDDAIVTALITACRQICEYYVNLSFIRRTVSVRIKNGLGNFYLPYGPVVSITSISDADNIDVPDYDVSKAYNGNLTVVYEAGYTTLPESLKLALKNQIAYSYENRGDAEKSTMLSPISQMILSQLRNVA